jgi:hypothetical protein
MTLHPHVLAAGRLAGRSLIWFGIVCLASSIVACICLGAFYLDLTSFVIIFIGWKTFTGSRTAARWGAICMGILVLASLIAIPAAIFPWNVVTVGGRHLKPSDAIWATPILLLIAVWALTNFWLCARTLQYSKRVEEAKCPACGYAIGTSPVCTECGHPLGKAATPS